MTLIKTTFIIAFGKMVATYDLVSRQWSDNFIFDDEVVKLLRYGDQDVTTISSVGVYLKNGKIKILASKLGESIGNEMPPTIWYITDNQNFEVKG